MSLEKKLQNLVQSAKISEAIPFVKELTPKEKKELQPLLLAINKEYLTYHKNEKTKRNERKANEDQVILLNIVSLLCLPKKEFEEHSSIVPHGMFQYKNKKEYKAELIKVLEYKNIKWIGKELLRWTQFDYLFYLELHRKVLVNVSRDIFMAKLPILIYETKRDNIYYNSTWTTTFHYDYLEIFPETLDEHIWWLFENETDLNRHDNNRENKKLPIWKNAFVDLTKAGKIDREKVLKESLLASNRNFNKFLSLWFIDLFLYLEPSEKELFELQPELFNILHSPQSKITNAVLTLFKKMVGHPDFKLQDFLESSNIFLNSEIKGIANTTLMLFDKLAKNDKGSDGKLIQKLSELSAVALMNKHKSIQLKAAKFIVKNGSTDNPILANEISQYSVNSFAESKTLLKEFINTKDTVQQTDTPEEDMEFDIQNLSDENKIETLETFDDLVFLASQVFENKEPYHLDLFLAGLLKFDKELNSAENFSKLEPAFQKACDTMQSTMIARAGYIGQMLANCFYNYGLYKIQQYPDATKSFAELNEAHKNNPKYMYYILNILSLEEWFSRSKYMIPFKMVMLNFFELLKNESGLPLLSTPTHKSFWIDPLVLVQRIEQYQQKKQTPYEGDFTLAIARCHISNAKRIKEALEYVKKNIKGENKKLLTYLLDKEHKIKDSNKSDGLWLQAALTKAPLKDFKPKEEIANVEYLDLYRGDVEWVTKHHSKETTKYSYKLKKNVPYTEQYPYVIVQYEKDKYKKYQRHKYRNYSFTTVYTTKYDWQPYLTNQYFEINRYPIYHENLDTKKLFGLCPNNPEIVFFWLINNTLYLSNATDRFNLEALTNATEMLLELNKSLGKLGHLFVVLCLFNINPTVRSIVAEYWIQAINNDLVDVAELGKCIGKVEAIEYGLLKRFTDLVTNQLLNVSKKHNLALEQMLAATIPLMNEKPIKNTKKLLEIYTELRHLNQKTNSPDNPPIQDPKILAQFENWKSSSSLKKIIKQLTN